MIPQGRLWAGSLVDHLQILNREVLWMIINSNTTADNAARKFNIVKSKNKKSAEKLASGYKINRAEDDIAYFQISEKMRGQIRGLAMADRNCQDALSMIQTANGAFEEVTEILQRCRELSVRASNDTLTDGDREAVGQEIDQLKEQMQVLNESTFNEISVFAQKGNFDLREDTENHSLAFQVGPLAGQFISVHLFSIDPEDLGIADADVRTREGASNAIEAFDAAEAYVHSKRSYYGAVGGRLEHALEQVTDYHYNITNAESRIRDTDYGREYVQYAMTDILMQSGVSMMVQANQSTKGVMSLLSFR